ncbi:hypothetical protein RND71_013905 [Anisodus tanguticus]|uniref:Uncharacterized protein n=1 Tax=Anisodus tanguticus TaxID=243964 RepID=A0AAE1VN84_9SOLA|nr:hypothetical protein RND71_013905 [Anisodus tanguticus]
MSKVVISTIITAFVFFVVLFIQFLKLNHTNAYYTPNSLSRRLGIKNRYPIFDPLVAELERKSKGNNKADNSSRRSHKKEDDKYFDNDGRLKTSLRLMVLFHILDVAPKDSFIEYKELEVWNTKQAIDRLHYRTRRELEFRDKDGDGAISFNEQMDVNKDHRLNRLEFSNGAYNIYKTYLEYESLGTNIPTPFEAFTKLDYNGDG